MFNIFPVLWIDTYVDHIYAHIRYFAGIPLPVDKQPKRLLKILIKKNRIKAKIKKKINRLACLYTAAVKNIRHTLYLLILYACMFLSGAHAPTQG